MSKGTILVDLDNTLFTYKSGMGKRFEVGAPIPLMVERVKDFLRDGYDVKIFTARWSFEPERPYTEKAIHAALAAVGLPPLEVCNTKDYNVVQIWDDRAVRVEAGTGRRIL